MALGMQSNASVGSIRMKQRNRDLATLAFMAPAVAAVRINQMATGGMSPVEFTRMWIEKPMALASSMATVQMELGLSAMAAMGNPWFRPRSLETTFGKALRPYAKSVSANHRRLAR